MTIEKITCPRLNNPYPNGRDEVFIRFNCDGEPYKILGCPQYLTDGNCEILHNGPKVLKECLYTEWKSLSK